MYIKMFRFIFVLSTNLTKQVSIFLQVIKLAKQLNSITQVNLLVFM